MLISNKMHVILVYLNEFIHMESFIKLFNCGPQGYGVRASLSALFGCLHHVPMNLSSAFQR